jgi:HEAT repeat protein/DNA-binding response OmpR family regulator
VLADQGDTDRRVIFMQALTRMGDQVVPPLIEAMQTPDPFQRRNVALTLGYIGDPRANGVLALHANDDPDTGAREAATEALSRTGGSRDALAQLLALGDDYYRQSDRVLMPHQVSDVIWLWRDRALESVVVPSYLYKDEMAKMSYLRALDAAPGSAEALAGIARAVVSEQATLEELVAAGEDGAEEWSQRLAEDVLALHAVGPGPVDVALGWSLDQGDQAGARGLARALAGLSLQPTANLGRAVREVGSGAVRGEAAIALGEIAYAANASAPPEVVQALAQAAGRDIARIAAVIDADDARRTSLASALEGRGMTVNSWKTAGRALAGLHSIPGVDVVVVADTLPDLTVGQVIADIRRDPRLAAAPILVVSGETERATELYGELATGVIGPDDVDAVEAATAEHLNRDREEANRLAARAADTLRRLAEAGHSDVGPATDALAGTLAARPDEVTIPAMHALAHDGGPRHAMACLAVLTDAERSDEARVASAEALAGIFARDPQAGHESAQALREVATSTDAAFAIRAAASKALGRLSLPPDQRSELVRAVRARLAPEGSATADATE